MICHDLEQCKHSWAPREDPKKYEDQHQVTILCLGGDQSEVGGSK